MGHDLKKGMGKDLIQEIGKDLKIGEKNEKIT